MKQNLKEKFLKLTSSLAMIEFSKIFKFTYVIGSKSLFFTISQAISPVTGLLGGFNLSLSVFLIKTVISVLKAFNILYHVPTFFASVYLSTNSKILKAVIPATCILLFLAHNGTNQVAFYALYWLIPIAIALLKNNNSIFLRALGSTFTAHATGTIIWLYTSKFDLVSLKTQIITLTGIVWAERILFAAVMTLAYYAIKHLEKYLENFITSKIYKTKALAQ